MNPKDCPSEQHIGTGFMSAAANRHRTMRSNRWSFVVSTTALLLLQPASAWRRPDGRRSDISPVRRPLACSSWLSPILSVATFPRGGTSLDEADDDEDAVLEEEINEVSSKDDVGEIVVEPLEPEIANDEYEKDLEVGNEEKDEEVDDEEDEEEDEDEDDVDVSTDVNIEGVQIELKVEKYDDPYFASPMSSLYASLGVMLLSRKVDLFHPTMVRIARFVFILYIVLHQCFLFYVRIQAKQHNDRTPIELKNPFSTLLQNQLGGSSDAALGGSMMKNLASSLLSSKSTVLDYDLKQARSLQSGLIFNMVFMWFLHFKMEQVQPLLIQSVNGFISLVYHPLFQVYVLGRNLERPFKTNALLDKVAEGSTAAATTDDSSGDTVADNDATESTDDAIAVNGDDDADDDDDTAVGSDDNDD